MGECILMKKKYLLITFIISILLFSIIFFSNNDLTSDSKVIQDDFSKYYSCLINLKKDEQFIINDYNSVTGEKYNNDHATLLILENVVIPNYNDFLQEVKKTETYCDEIKKTHDIYITYAEKTLEAFTCFKEGIEENDSSKIKNGKDNLDCAKGYLKDFDKKLSKLSSKYNTKISKEGEI